MKEIVKRGFTFIKSAGWWKFSLYVDGEKLLESDQYFKARWIAVRSAVALVSRGHTEMEAVKGGQRVRCFNGKNQTLAYSGIYHQRKLADETHREAVEIMAEMTREAQETPRSFGKAVLQGIGAAFLLAALFTAIMMMAEASEKHFVDYEALNNENFLDCTPRRDGNPLLIFTLCQLSRGPAGRVFDGMDPVVTSFNRKSQHHGGNAIDFYYPIYTGDKCQVLRAYHQIILDIQSRLAEIGLLERVGLGCPYIENKESGNLVCHIDLRGKRARWSFHKDRMISYSAGMDVLESLVRKHCSS